jgi:sucrose-6-phosphate hydrolase SacC (GH32 family)
MEHLEGLYRERLRPQVHFSAARGWINDPNGLVYHDGEYHLFFQHNPYSEQWGNMHWGHAVSEDLVHWKQLDEALYPDEIGFAFSGSCVIDERNSSGLGTDGNPPMVAVYTHAFFPTPDDLAAGRQFMERQSVGWSNDRGRTWTTHPDNPVIGDQREKLGTHNSRDPYVFWYEPGEHWVMVLFERLELVIYNSDDLVHWSEQSRFGTFWECPCMFALPVDADASDVKWVVHAGIGDYLIGSFDGKVFTPESGVHNYVRGHLFAAQSFNNIPASDGRRIQIGWAHLTADGMPFNSMMGVPTELSLRTTANGVRLFCEPVREFSGLHLREIAGTDLDHSDVAPLLEELNTEKLHIRLEVEDRTAMTWGLQIGADSLLYSLHDNAFFLNDREGYLGNKIGQLRYLPELGRRKMSLEIILDRTSIEVFVDDGAFVMVLPRTAPDTGDPPNYGQISMVTDPDGELHVHSLRAWELASIWQ